MSGAERVAGYFGDSAELQRRCAGSIADAVVRAAATLRTCLDSGGKVLVCGNGGSAAEAQHFASELVNRFERDRPAWGAMSLCTDGSALTSIANDASYEEVFARQVAALGRAGDVLLGLTTSGDSENVARAIAAAHQRSMPVVLLGGGEGGRCAGALDAGDVEVRVPHAVTARIQEAHLVIIHALCALLEAD